MTSLNGKRLKLVEQLTYISSTEKNVNICKGNDEMEMWYKIKRYFFQTAMVSVILYGCNTLTKMSKEKAQ